MKLNGDLNISAVRTLNGNATLLSTVRVCNGYAMNVERQQHRHSVAIVWIRNRNFIFSPTVLAKDKRESDLILWYIHFHSVVW